MFITIEFTLDFDYSNKTDLDRKFHLHFKNLTVPRVIPRLFVCVPSYLDNALLWVCPASVCIVRDMQYDSVGFLGSRKKVDMI